MKQIFLRGVDVRNLFLAILLVILTVIAAPAFSSQTNPIEVKITATAPDRASSTDRLNYSGDCSDKRFHVQIEFTAKRAGTYSYSEITRDDAKGSLKTITFDKPGQQTVDMGIPTENTKGFWMQVQVLKPVQINSNRIEMSADCKNNAPKGVQPQKTPKKSATKTDSLTSSGSAGINDVSARKSAPPSGTCYSFEQKTMRVEDFKGKPALIADVKGSVHSLYNAKDSNDANQALNAAQAHALNEICYIGKTTSFRYFLSSGQHPTGSFTGEKCTSFNPASVKVTEQQMKSKSDPNKSAGTFWAIVDGERIIRGFGNSEDSKATANEVLQVIKKFAFTDLCGAGGFNYLLRK